MSIPPSAHLVTRLSKPGSALFSLCVLPLPVRLGHTAEYNDGLVASMSHILPSLSASIPVKNPHLLLCSFHLPLRCHHGTETPSDPRPGSRNPDSAVLRLLPPVPHTCFVSLPRGHQCGSSDLSLPLRGLFYTQL